MPGRAIGASTAWKRVPSAQPHVDVRRRVVEPAPAQRGQPLGEPADGLLVGEPDGGRAPGRAPRSTEDLAGAVDQDVGDAGRCAAAARAGPRPRRRGAAPRGRRAPSRRRPGGRSSRSASATRCGVSVARAVGQPVADVVDARRAAAPRSRRRRRAARAGRAPAARPDPAARGGSAPVPARGRWPRRVRAGRASAAATGTPVARATRLGVDAATADHQAQGRRIGEARTQPPRGGDAGHASGP